MKYYTEKIIKSDFDSAITKTQEALKNEGFGVLSEIKINEKLKEKLGVEFRKYTILGACNPPLAHEALQTENKIGTMLPCNVIVQEIGDNEVEVAAIDPFASMQVVDNEELSRIAKEVKEKLDTVIENL
ncbi:hypothetical protein L21SP5_01579 [Salinivirga cyanobacteriivorans]|uniref:DUF302 domain-containing protein n=1 Tax=Salinivirga cyanobacteriivorans TaxID=1307839 RepID=A0A0S2HYL8_9BACT|nr:DUF302 domain-containing protein [Salinivirga cyanobacteriivorans]ALO15225.1 hypothetical protein L21SP5_01579 [Salinivirga cyanobacteriivorans]